MATPKFIDLCLTKHEIFLRFQGAAASEPWASYSTDSTGKLAFARNATLPPATAILSRRTVTAIYGAFQLLRGYYLAVVTKSQQIAKGPYGSSIHQIDDMEWLPIHIKDASQLTSAEEREEELYLNLLREISERDCFYFAVGYDLTNSVQRFDAFLSRALGAAASPSPSTPGAGATAAVASVADAVTSAAVSPAVASESLRPAVGARLPVSTATVASVLPAPSHRLPVSTADDRFFWNKAACAELLASGGDDFVTPIINGYVCQAAGVNFGETPTGTGTVDITLISRRASTRQGTRFNMRGADNDGYVANYAETEQLVQLSDGRVSSYVQVRGSIPLLWEQPATMKYTPRVRISLDDDANTAVFAKHAESQLRVYGHVTAVNLIDKKKDQKTLGDKYQALVERYAASKGVSLGAAGSGGSGSAASAAVVPVGGAGASGSAASATVYDYVWFDFHHECRKMQWGNLSKLVGQVDAQIARNGLYSKDSSGCVLSTQTGVFRTNCMDNLDRTNVVQSLFARRAALMGVPGAWEKTVASNLSVLTSPFPAFEHAFNNLWANNADAVSMLYSGTGALKTDFTRTGKRTMAGALSDGINSVKRYVLNNLVDGRTQDAWDLFTGRFIPHRHKASHRHHRHGHHAHHPHHTHSTGVVRTASGTAYGVEDVSEATAPVKAHMEGPTPTSFFLHTFIFFATLTALATAAIGFVAPHQTFAFRTSVGAAVAAAVVAGAGYALVAKGVSFGTQMVSKPRFIKPEPLVHPGSGAKAVVAPVAGGSASGRVKLA